MSLSERVYRLMLRLYPAGFRQEYGNEMTQTFRDMHRDAAGRGLAGGINLWLYLFVETLSRALIEHRDAIRNYPGVKVEYTPSKRDLLWVFVPLLTIMLYLYGASGYGDIFLVYLLILFVGGGGWLLSRFGRFRANRLWNTYTVGILLGILSFFIYFGATLLGFGMYQLRLPAAVIHLTTAILYTTAIVLSGRLVGANRRLYFITAALLAVTSTVALLIDPRRYTGDDTITAISLNFTMMQTFSLLCLAAISIWLRRFFGQRALILLIVALGVQLIVIDPGYFTGDAARWINLTVLILPLIACPAWLWMAKSRRAQFWGTLGLWVILTAVIVIVPSIARTALGLDHETPALWLYRLLTALPYLAAMVMALWAARSDVDSDSGEASSTDARRVVPTTLNPR